MLTGDSYSKHYGICRAQVPFFLLRRNNLMFAKNDYIIYGTTGVCKITGIEKKKFNNMEREYYILKPAYDPNSTIYAPVDNNMINIRKIMTVKEVYDLIKTMPDNKPIWIDDINLRKEKYNEILKKGDKVELVKLIRTLYLEKEKKKNENKRILLSPLHASFP